MWLWRGNEPGRLVRPPAWLDSTLRGADIITREEARDQKKPPRVTKRYIYNLHLEHPVRPDTPVSPFPPPIMRSPYSPLFTSGLLSEPSSSRPSSRAASYSEEAAPIRRGSLQGVADTPKSASRGKSFHKMMSPTDEASAFYFTLQSRRDSAEFRSFLSLDLAESSSMRSASLRRKASDASKWQSMSTGSKSKWGGTRKSSYVSLSMSMPVNPF